MKTIKLFKDTQHALSPTQLAFRLDNSYANMLGFCEGFLQEYGGSVIPDDLPFLV